MKIVNIVPGFGGTFYCGNCLRDSGFVSSLREEGHDAIILPVYLPLTLNGKQSDPDIPVFYGAVNIYLKQQFPVFRNMPHWLEHLFNSSPVLKIAARKAGSTRAHGLEHLTESMLLGVEGYQSRELDELVHYLRVHEKPDVVHFSNALLLGMACRIKEKVGVPVVCSLQDEDVWVDAMHEDYQTKIWDLMADKARDVDAFIAVSHYFARKMQKKMQIPEDKLHVIPIGIKPGLYDYNSRAEEPRAIGFLSRMCPENGLEILVDAFLRLRSDPEFEDVKLKLTGGITADDKPFLRKQLDKVSKKGLAGEVQIIHDFSFAALKDFFKSISVLSVPVLKGEAFGLYQLEALASGIPLVQPDLGAFPEIIHATGGGLIYHPNTSDALADALGKVLSDQAGLMKMSRNGRKAVEEKFNCSGIVIKMMEIYQHVQKPI